MGQTERRQGTRGEARLRTRVLLWVLQGLLAALFVFAGTMKLVLPIEAMAGPVALPGAFLRFIGVAELLGGLGLVLPGLLRIRPSLTPLAAAGLVIIMVGATAISLRVGIGAALMPFFVGLLTAFVAYGRSRVAPHPVSWRRPATLQAAA
jgi:uncharacterized membrane protein YphA (DoxX/SURF4 family)